MGEAGERVDRGEDTGATAGAFLQRIDMRGGIGTEEKPLVAGRRGLSQRQTMAFALGNRQAVVMRLDTAGQYGVAVDVRNGDFLAMDVHEWHSNTKLIPVTKDYSRLSMVCYLRENMIKCKNLI